MDIKLSYTEKGSGEPLVLLHGNGEDTTYFKNQIEYFSAQFRVIAVDTRGHGKSPRGTAPFCIRQFAEDLREFMDEMGIEKANILGFSDGGNIAMVFALKYPTRVARLILNGANLKGSGVKFLVQFPIIIGYKLAKLSKAAEAVRKAELLGLMVNDPNLEASELAKIKARTLVIVGTKDMIKDSHSRLIFESLPNAEFCRIEGDHFIAANNAEAFNKAVDDFLNKD